MEQWEVSVKQENRTATGAIRFSMFKSVAGKTGCVVLEDYEGNHLERIEINWITI